MPKRFTDTDKWEDPWFFDLSPKYRWMWLYLLDRCDHAGIWKVNLRMAGLIIGDVYEENEVLEVMNPRVRKVNGGTRWFIPKFLLFQYGKLNPAVAMHRSVINTLELIEEGLSKGYVRVDEPYKEKKKEKIKEKKNIITEIIKDLNTVLGTKYIDTAVGTVKLINARLEEGYKLDDFRKAHRNMQQKWSKDPKMCTYLRPDTLYTSKFGGYVNLISKKEFNYAD